MHPELRRYLAAGLSLRAADTAAARRFLAELTGRPRSPEAAAAAGDAAGSVRAQLARAAGDADDALRELEAVQAPEARVGLIGGSPFYSQGLERFTYASLLEERGRMEEAAQWYGSFSSNSIFDLVYLAPAHLRQGWLEERAGRTAAAAEHFRSVARLWRDSDEELGGMVREAEAGLERTVTAMR